MKKRKPKGRKKKIPILLPIVLCVAGACVSFIVLYRIIIDRSAKIISPVYEEIYSSDTDLKEGIKNVDRAIYQSIYKSGVKEKDVVSLRVQPRHKNGYAWEYTESLVNCQDNQRILNLAKEIRTALAASGVGARVRVQENKGAEGKIICSVFIKEFLTHKIILTFQSPRPIKDIRPKVAIIIDDLGYDRDTDLSFFQLDLPLSFSVLPYGPFTQAFVKKANQNGYELILHLPMEPKNYPVVKPGPGALYLSMDSNEILHALDQDLRQIKEARGVNNHMGSSFTENRNKMRAVLTELKRRGLYFIDSRTTKSTVGLELAREIGVRADRRRVFLDNNLDPNAMRIQMDRLLSMARRHGSAIAIGHSYKETFKLLKEYRSKIRSQCQMVPASELVK